MKKIKLFGTLGKKFGRVHHFKVNSPAEAIRALCANFPLFEKELIESESKNVGYKVINGTHHLDSEEEALQPASGVIKIIPAVLGSSGQTKILIGASLIAVGAILNATPAAGASPFFYKAGAVFILSGISQLLTKTPSLGEIYEAKEENKPSYIFNGPVNTTNQGHPVPICYGKLTVGAAVISAGIVIDQIMAGYRYVQKTYTKDISSSEYETWYSEQPPANWFRRELLNHGTTTKDIGDGNTIPVECWSWRFYYYVIEKEAVPV